MRPWVALALQAAAWPRPTYRAAFTTAVPW
jgi:hypothetical protein